MATLEQLGSEKYALLTTFRRDGRAVSTPLWIVPEGDGRVAFWTPKETGKVKRIRNSGRVTVTACDFRGNTHGDAVEGVARLGDGADLHRVKSELRRKYGFTAWMSIFGSKLRRGADGTVAILVDPA